MKPTIAQVTGPREVRLVRTFPGPIERLWEYLTDPAKRRTWLADGPMELRVGGAVELRFLHRDLSLHKEETPADYQDMKNGKIVRGKITRCEAPHTLAFTWDKDTDDQSEVNFELVPEGKNVRLLVTHRNLPSRDHMRGVSTGWHVHTGILLDRLEGREPPPFWKTFQEVKSGYDQTIA